jgi:hypothetical protein
MVLVWVDEDVGAQTAAQNRVSGCQYCVLVKELPDTVSVVRGIPLWVSFPLLIIVSCTVWCSLSPAHEVILFVKRSLDDFIAV